MTFKNLNNLFILSFIFMLLTVSACNNNCKDVVCATGTCDEDTGDCLCVCGYGNCDAVTGECINVTCAYGTVDPLTGECVNTCTYGTPDPVTGECSNTCDYGTVDPATGVCSNSACTTGSVNPETGECACDGCVNGTCSGETGICACDTGYEGDSCSVRWTAKFAGTYTTYDTCNGTGSPAPNTSTITESVDTLLRINFEGYNGSPAVFYGILDDDMNFNIPAGQPYGLSEIVGSSGSINSDGTEIRIYLDIYRPLVPDTMVCRSTFVKM